MLKQWMSRSMLVGFCLALLATAITAAPDRAHAWQPAKNIEFIVGAGSGGGNDRTARVIQKILLERKLVPTQIVVVNKPGAGGVVAQDYLNTHSGDGHYLMITNPALVTNPLTGVGTANYTDITPIAQL
ncbi:MAG TPA: tripartite tricarboxylate transporter substrate-binding protein, partial [Burkholderiales bacterium]|nr:tripartite tricarboxylate transporter substrate-binding protein [Burkholderiales bacterium]